MPLDQSLLSGFLLLVVENDSTHRELLTLLLQEFGAKVVAVASAREALKALEQHQPDILISELVLSKQDEEDGYWLLRKLRSGSTEVSQIPAIAFTVAATKQDYLQALTAGFDRHLPKPTDIEELVTILKSLSRSPTNKSLIHK